MKILFWAILFLLLQGCAGTVREPQSETYSISEDGTVVWNQEYAFQRPSEKWQFFPMEEDLTIGFFRIGEDNVSANTSFGYHEEPFGYSRKLDQRLEEFYKRFLWAGRVTWGSPQTREITVFGGKGLEATAIGKDPVRGNKVFSKVILAHRGERVVAFYFTQWRRMEKTFDPSMEKDFLDFVDSFRFLKPSFYETL